MATLNNKDLSARMSKRLANFKLSDAAIKGLADRIRIDGLMIGRLDPCIPGICIDYFTYERPKLDAFTRQRGVVKWEVFPYGIIDRDHFHVAFEVDELQGMVHGSPRR